MHNSKGWMKAAAFLLVCILVNGVLEFGLMPSTYARLSVHQIEENEYEDIFIGTSRGFAGISPAQVSTVTGRSSTSLCLGSVFPLDELYLLKEVCRDGKPKRIIYVLDPSYYTVDAFQGMEDPFLYNELPMSFVKVQYGLDKYISQDFRILTFPWLFHRNGFSTVKSTVQTKLSEGYKNYDPIVASDGQAQYMLGGFLYYHKPEKPEVKDDSFLAFCKEEVKADREEDFLRIVAYCKSEGIELVAITLPVPEGTIGAHPEGYEMAYDYYSNLLDENEIDYLDFNEIEDVRVDKNDGNYRDSEGHMYGDAAERFSKIMGAYLKKD